jgi:hypothetical protein
LIQLPTSDFATAFLIVVIAATAGLFLYASYWAFTTRKVLVAQIYRRQALWVAINGLYFALFFIFAAAAVALGGPNISNIYADVLADIFTVVAFIAIFAWMDASIRVGRRSDPLHRDTLLWSKLRYFILVVSSFGIFFSLIFPSSYQQANTSSVVQGSALLGPLGTALFLGGIALFLSAKRSRDSILQRHLKWFAAFVIFLWATSQLPHFLSQSIYFELVNYALFLISSFFLYQSAKSLTQVNPYPSQEQTQSSVSTPAS